MRNDTTFAELYDAYAEAILRKDELYSSLLDLPPLRRLKGISFLGAIQVLSPSDGEGSYGLSRYEHTIGVAYLTYRACLVLGQSETQQRAYVSAALLHDIGHGALSHSIEPYFMHRYGLNHKHCGERLIRGDLFLGAELPDALRDFKVEPDTVTSLLAGPRSRELDYLLHGPLNTDTLDGIIRAASFFSAERRSDWTPLDLLQALLSWDDRATVGGDYFWALKDAVYNQYIFNEDWSIYDAIVSLVLEKGEAKLSYDDFLLNDHQLADKFRIEFRSARDLLTRRPNELKYVLERLYQFKSKVGRRFITNDHIRLVGPATLSARYVTTRGTQ